MKIQYVGIFAIAAVCQLSLPSNAIVNILEEKTISGDACQRSNESFDKPTQRAKTELEENLRIFLRSLDVGLDITVTYVKCENYSKQIENNYIPCIECKARVAYPRNHNR